MSRSRRQDPVEFKARLVIEEALKEQRTINEIAAEHDVNPNLMFKWRKEFLAHAERVFDEPKR